MALAATPEILVAQDFLGHGLAGEVDQLALAGRIDLIRRYGDHCPGSFLQRFVVLDRPALVPKKEEKSGDEKDQANNDALDRLFKTAEPGLPADFGEMILGHEQ